VDNGSGGQIADRRRPIAPRIGCPGHWQRQAHCAGGDGGKRAHGASRKRHKKYIHRAGDASCWPCRRDGPSVYGISWWRRRAGRSTGEPRMWCRTTGRPRRADALCDLGIARRVRRVRCL